MKPVVPCGICNYDRVTERAHIVAASLCGPDTEENILHLCPNHHALFDAGKLAADEKQLILPKCENALREAIAVCERLLRTLASTNAGEKEQLR